MLRETLFLEFCAQHVVTLRSVHTRVMVNGEWRVVNGEHVNREAVHTIEPLKEGGTRPALPTHPPAGPRRESGWVFDGKDIRPDGSGRRE